MVAKSFQTFEQIGDPFEANGKKYVVVKNPKTGNERTVRWYTEQEYAKLYPTEENVNKQTRSLKEVLGFEKGYITIFSNTEVHEEWFSNCGNARWHGIWGWYIISTEEVPAQLPTAVKAFRLYWDDIATTDNTLKSKPEIVNHLNAILYGETSSSEYVGEIGSRFDFNVTITNIVTTSTSYGIKAMYTMTDDFGNVFKWFTSPRKLKVGDIWQMRGTVKGYTMEKNVKITMLTRCMERKS